MGGALGLEGEAGEVRPFADRMCAAAGEAQAGERVHIGRDEAAVGGAAQGGSIRGISGGRAPGSPR
jgi:hypothetical protein